MSDVIDRANQEAQTWTAEQIRQIQKTQTPTDDTECVDCGGEIGDKRKQALPSAIRCVGCQWQYERTHDRRGGR